VASWFISGFLILITGSQYPILKHPALDSPGIEEVWLDGKIPSIVP
jgi:hypothetical protein